MIIILNINSEKFSLNGIPYFKNFMPHVVAGKLKIVNIYDSKFVLTELDVFTNYLVDDVLFESVSELQDALLPVLYTRNSLNFTSDLPYYNQITKETGFTSLGLTKTFNAGWEWLINNVSYTNSSEIEITFPLASSGKQRLDRVVATNVNTFIRIPGVESISSPTAEPRPVNTVDVTFVLVTDSEVGDPTPPVIGDDKLDKDGYIGTAKTLSDEIESLKTPTGNGPYVAKLEFSLKPIELDGVISTLPLGDINHYLSFNSSATELHTISVPIPDMLYSGRPLFIRNNQATDLIIKHEGSGAGTYTFHFPNELDFVLKPNEIIEFKLRFTLTNAGVYDYVGIISDLDNYYTKTEVDSKISSVLKYKGSVANYASLPSTDQEVGDTYNLTDTGHNYAWTGTLWDDLGPAVDISGKEDSVNKSTSTADSGSSVKFPVWSAIVSFFTSTQIKSILGISTLSGSNTGDETTATLKSKIDDYISLALSDETSNLTVGNLISFRMPYAMTLSEVRISVNDAPTVSSIIVDVKESGVSIFSTLVSIDATELTSVTAAIPAVISDANLSDDALITISTTQVGSGNTGKGLKLVLKGKKA